MQASKCIVFLITRSHYNFLLALYSSTDQHQQPQRADDRAGQVHHTDFAPREPSRSISARQGPRPVTSRPQRFALPDLHLVMPGSFAGQGRGSRKKPLGSHSRDLLATTYFFRSCASSPLSPVPPRKGGRGDRSAGRASPPFTALRDVIRSARGSVRRIFCLTIVKVRLAERRPLRYDEGTGAWLAGRRNRSRVSPAILLIGKP